MWNTFGLSFKFLTVCFGLKNVLFSLMSIHNVYMDMREKCVWAYTYISNWFLQALQKMIESLEKHDGS